MNFSANIYRLLMLLLVLLATSCNHNEDIPVTPDSDTDKVHFTIGVSLPGASPTDSRAFGGEGNTDGTGSGGYFEFSDLYVAVFVEIDGISYLEEFVKAESTVPTWNSEGYWEFGVELTKTDGPRRLHLIANYPDLMLGFGEEGELIGRLLANGADHDVYWNYRNLARIDEGFETELRNVPLIRNYVQIRLNQTALDSDNFILDQYALYNVPTKGTVAPYNPSSTSNKFANFVDVGNKCQSYSYMLNTEKYKGNEPFDDGSFLDKNVSQLDWKEPDEPTYIYERNHSNTNEPTCMLIKGRYVENGEPTLETPPTYYKLDFVYDETDTNSKVYYNLLRNFIYTMNVNSVTGPGYNSIEEALKQPASNNIGGDAVAKDYTNISDGIGRLFVSSTYILFTKQKTVDLYYKYIPDIVEAPNTTANGSVTITPQTGEVLNNPSNPMTGTAVTGGQYDKWNKVQLVSNEVQTESKSQHIIFAAGNLQREVELILRSPYTLDVDVLQDKVDTQANKPVTIEIELPGGIEQLFPLRLFISSQDNTIYPDYGTNIPAESQNGKYGFIKEVSLLEYQNSNTITCNFLTNCADNATTVYVDNEFFERGSDSFKNDWENTITLGTSVAVDIERIYGRYPKNIYNDGGNNGTETVQVILNGINAGTITINKEKVTTNITFTNNEGLSKRDVVVFTFEDEYWYGENNWSPTTYQATSTLGEIDAGKTLQFKAEYNKIKSITISNTQAVKVQQDQSRYPQKIYNSGQNNGTENVEIKLNGKSIGEITINKDNVTTNITLNNDEGFSYDDVLTFTFSDKYYWWIFVSGWSDATYKATCTVADLLNGDVTLNFTR